jgi:hypothetical protein
MREPTLYVIDDFYENPDEIRNIALNVEFHKRKDAPYPGFEGQSTESWDKVIGTIKGIIPEACELSDANYKYPQGKFHLAYAADQAVRNVGVHVDIPRWSAVIFLSKTPDMKGGIHWYKHKATGARTDSQEFIEYCMNFIGPQERDQMKTHIMKYSNIADEWEEIQRVAMVYNRMVLFRADFFHANSYLFGDNKENGRLTQHFVFYSTHQS